jgi:hypothetical protein
MHVRGHGDSADALRARARVACSGSGHECVVVRVRLELVAGAGVREFRPGRGGVEDDLDVEVGLYVVGGQVVAVASGDENECGVGSGRRDVAGRDGEGDLVGGHAGSGAWVVCFDLMSAMISLITSPTSSAAVFAG